MMCLTLKYVDETYLHIVHAAVVLNKPLNWKWQILQPNVYKLKTETGSHKDCWHTGTELSAMDYRVLHNTAY